ncbi:MAG: hypothetical protein FJ405_19865, partial [Verrucomicrobia bacterium]|nr:hypothetical protein [Verrucomicrobiota bacterium]
MKTIVIACTLLMTAFGLLGADPDLKADIAKAAGKLNDASGYAWTTRMDSGGSSGRPSTPVKGTTEKGGVSHIVITRGENDMEALVKGSKSAVKIQDSWHSLDSIPDAGGGGGGQRNPARMIARLIQSFKPPGALALELSGK